MNMSQKVNPEKCCKICRKWTW